MGWELVWLVNNDLGMLTNEDKLSGLFLRLMDAVLAKPNGWVTAAYSKRAQRCVVDIHYSCYPQTLELLYKDYPHNIYR